MSSDSQELPFETYEREVISPLRGHKLTPVEEYVAGLLLDTSKERPITNADIRARLMIRFDMKKINTRTIKRVIRSLRKAHIFPILALTQPPYGYWWSKSADELVEYYNDASSRAKDELQTLYWMVKVNHPDYVGQLRLEGAEDE